MKPALFIFTTLLLFSLLYSCNLGTHEKKKATQSKVLPVLSWSEESIKIAQGTWVKSDSKENSESFTIQNDTLINHQQELYKIKLTTDSLWSTSQILDSLERIELKPKVGFMYLQNVTTDSLVFWNWDHGKKLYSVYLKRK